MLLALPIVAYLSWVFDIGPDDEVRRAASGKPWLEASITAIALVCLGIGCWMVLTPSGSATSNRAASDLNAPDTKMRSIAVLPLENLSGDSEQEFFSDGTTDMLIQELRKIRSLRIISRQSVVQYKSSAETAGSIAAALNVDGLLTGTVIQTPELVRFTLQLYDAASDRIIWAKSLDRSPTHILALQSDIARAVSQQIGIELTGSEFATLSVSREVDPESHKAYLRGRFHVNLGNYAAAAESFKLSTNLDPLNPDPLAELARLANIDVWGGTPVQERITAIRRYTQRALVLDPGHAHAQAEEALLLWYVDREYQQSIDKFAELLNANPSNLYVLLYYSFVMQTFDRLDLRLKLYDRIIELEPTNAAQIADQGQIYQSLGDYEKALEFYEQAELLGKKNPVLLANLALDQSDRKSLAIQLQREWGDVAVWRPLFEAELAKMDGDMQRASTIIQPYDNEQSQGFWWIRHYYPLILSETERAVEYYSNALENREPVPLMLALGSVGDHKRNPEFYSHPKHQEMLRSNGLDPESIAKLRFPPLPF